MVALATWGVGCTSILGGDYRAVESAGGDGGQGGAAPGGAAGHGPGGTAGEGGDAVVGGTGGTAPLACPGSAMGPPMARIETPEWSYCIDQTEVTRAQYQAFVEAAVTPQSVSGEPIECGWNASYTPEQDYPPSAAEAALPVVEVDWCDALAYCTWAGKRLCGRFGGGPLDPSGAADPAESEWTNVCSSYGMTAYPYGSMFDEAKCNVSLVFGGGLDDVGSFPDCRGRLAPFAQVVDLSGNASEWENSCETSGGGGPADACLRRGGYFTGDAMSVRCDAAVLSSRTLANGNTSFRCCSDLE
jgi:formylglycine-generating enzyme